MVWRVEYSSEAIIALRRMPTNTARVIQAKVKRLAQDPYAPNNNVKSLKGREGYRLRVGDWRVIYDLHDGVLLIEVLAIGPRGSVYD